MNTTIEHQVENEYLLEKCREQGLEIRSFDGWRLAGRWVKKGQKQKAYRVRCGTTQRMDPITGEMIATPATKLAYGFTADQVN